MNRVWCEHLPLDELCSHATLELLADESFHPIIAVRPSTDATQLADVLAELSARRLQPGIWPLLEREAGYWPSERNVTEWAANATAWLDQLADRGVMPPWLAIDLEPPLDQASRLLRKTLDVPATALKFGRENLDIVRFRAAESEFRVFADTARARGVKTLGITLPMAAHDLRDDEPLWQDMFETPWSSIGWDRAGIMAYGSIVSGASIGVLSHADARAIHQLLIDHLRGRFGAAAHVSLGVTGAGVFGDEPAWEHPGELALDASAARAAGIEDIGLFCLEGILDRPSPEQWLRAVSRAEPILPRHTWKAGVVRHAARAFRHWTRRRFAR